MGQSVAFAQFVFETASGDLYRDGRPIRLPAQSARLLALFLENPQVVLTRDDLRTHLWPDGSFVNYDKSINRAVGELRYLLRAASSKPRTPTEDYIETLPKRGYRFVAPIQQHVPPAPPSEMPGSIGSPAGMEGDMPPSQAHIAVDDVSQLRRSTDVISSVGSLFPRDRIWLHGRSRWFLISAVLSLLVVALGFMLRAHRPLSPARKTVAQPLKTVSSPLTIGIVPFESTGNAAGPLAESFRLDLADSLSQIPRVRVSTLGTLRSDAEKGKQRSMPLHIDAILSGHITVSADQCHLQFEMVRADDGSHLLSLQYNGKREELASIRDRMEANIFQKLKTSSQSNSFVVQKTSSPEAYDNYLIGRSNISIGTEEALQLSIRSFEASIKEDPQYAHAYAGAASAYYLLGQTSIPEPLKYVEKARQFAAKALAMDNSLAEAHEILGEIAMTNDWNFAEANEQFHQVIELDPSNAQYHQCLAVLSTVEGRYDVASREIGKARAADPDRNSFYFTEIYIFTESRQFDRADQVFAQLFKKMPSWGLVHEDRGLMLWEMKRYEQAIEEWHRAALLDKNTDRARLEEQGADVFRKGGVIAYAQLRLRAISTRKGISYEKFSFDPAEWNAYAGNKDQALKEISAFVDRHASEALELGTNPAYEQFHNDPRFLALLRRVGLPDPRY